MQIHSGWAVCTRRNESGVPEKRTGESGSSNDEEDGGSVPGGNAAAMKGLVKQKLYFIN